MESVIQEDKAGEKYWTEVWKNVSLPDRIDVNDKSLKNYVNLQFHNFFSSFLKSQDTSGKKFLEIGCGNSVWLPYFAEHYGFEITGIDYSEYGCEQCRRILDRDRIKGEIICADAFNPPENLLEKFDYVISLGVVEHFQDTAGTIKAFSKFLKPGGILITSIPNHAGLLGWLQKIFNRPVYDIHVILDKRDLENAVRKNEMEILKSEYLISISLHVNIDAKDGKEVSMKSVKKIFGKMLDVITNVTWLLDQNFFLFNGSKTFSPAIGVIAIKKND